MRNRQANRRCYTWQLRSPFKKQFDRSHWWDGKGESEIEPNAALYELARRHPLVRETWLRNFAAQTHSRRGIAIWLPQIREEWTRKILRPTRNTSCPHSLYWTCLFGLNSWAKLDYTDRRNWESSVGKLKGLDLRSQDLHCRCIKVFAHWKIIDQRRQLLRDKAETYDALNKLVRADLAKNPPTAEEWGTSVAECAVEANRQGYVLLAVAPDLAADKAVSAMAKKYREHLGLFPTPMPKQRARWQDWLKIISEFEKAETSPHKAKSQVFARYRRAIDGILFT